MDSTHNTSAYKYEFLTVLVLDSFGHGIPVAHFIYKSESEAPYFVMFDILKTLRPDTRPSQLMTDCNLSAGNAADLVWGKFQNNRGNNKKICNSH